MRPARRSSPKQQDPHIQPARPPVAAFVAQVIAQFEPNETDMRTAASAYAAIDDLAYQLPKVEVASL